MTSTKQLPMIDFSLPPLLNKSCKALSDADGVISISLKGKTRTGNVYRISLASFVRKDDQHKKYTEVAIGIGGDQQVYFMFNPGSAVLERERYRVGTGSIISSMPKVIQLLEHLKLEIPTEDDTILNVDFKLVPVNGDLYRVKFLLEPDMTW